MATVQMNTRIDATLKAQGDATFAELGFTPSEAVRLMWGFAARNRHDHKVLSSMIAQLSGTRAKRNDEQAVAKRVNWALQGQDLVRQYAEALHLDKPSSQLLACGDIDDELAAILEEDAARIILEADAALASPSKE